MGRSSSIEGRLWQKEIEAAIQDCLPIRRIARAFDLSPSAVARHKRKMLREAAAELAKADQAARPHPKPRRPRGRPSVVANHPDRDEIRKAMIRWEGYLNREPGGITVRPLSPQKIAKQHGVSLRSLKRWWVTERDAILDKVYPPPQSSASYKAIVEVERLVQTFRRSTDRSPLPSYFEQVELGLRDFAEQAAQDLLPEERALFTGLCAAASCIFHAALCDGERLTEQDRACQEAMIMGYVADFTKLTLVIFSDRAEFSLLLTRLPPTSHRSKAQGFRRSQPRALAPG